MIEKGVFKVEWHCGVANESMNANATLVQFFTWMALPESMANELFETGRLSMGRFTQGQRNASRNALPQDSTMVRSKHVHRA